jgi:sialate O-acetylesterase
VKPISIPCLKSFYGLLFLLVSTLASTNSIAFVCPTYKSEKITLFNEQTIQPTTDGFLAQSGGTFNTSFTYADLKRLSNFNREIYLTYNFSNLTVTANSAKLRIFCQSFDKFGDLKLSLYCLPEYQTTGLTWASRPTVSTAIATKWINQIDDSNTMLEFDISSCLASILASQSKQATFVLKITSGNDALLKFSMNESTNNKPSIVVSDETPLNLGVNSTLKMPILFADNMVLQRDKPIRVWGEVLPNLPVTITFDGQTYNTQSGANGLFSTFLPVKSASANSYTLTVSSNNETFSYTNIVMGDVYLCGGQSNMLMTVNGINPDQLANATADANYPNLRFFEVAKIVSGGFVLNAPDNPWKIAIPERVINWSAVAFFVGRDLHKEINVPIGLINVSHGGAPSDAFISPEAYANDPVLNAAKRPGGGGVLSYYTTPSSLYNAMISKVVGYPIKAVLWYQAEANSSYWPVYKTIFKGLIKDWRAQFNEPTLPWLFVQLPGFAADGSTNTSWAEIRDIQLQVSKEDPSTRMAVTIDLGEENDIHPKDKYTVAKRMLPQVKALVYGEQIIHKSPIYKWHELQGADLIIAFDNLGSGLTATKSMTEFEIAGPDKIYKAATATILPDNRIKLTNATIPSPFYARYAFINFPTVSVYTMDTLSLPLSPFKTEMEGCKCD